MNTRWINAESLKARLVRMWETGQLTRTKYQTFLEILEAEPTADYRERGEWHGNDRHRSCSICHMTYCVPDGVEGKLDMSDYHFCPNCGSRNEVIV